MIRACVGPNGEQGVCWEDATGNRDTCHTVDPALEGAELDAAKAEAVRLAAKDGNRAAGHGDPRMMRDG